MRKHVWRLSFSVGVIWQVWAAQEYWSCCHGNPGRCHDSKIFSLSHHPGHTVQKAARSHIGLWISVYKSSVPAHIYDLKCVQHIYTHVFRFFWEPYYIYNFLGSHFSIVGFEERTEANRLWELAIYNVFGSPLLDFCFYTHTYLDSLQFFVKFTESDFDIP